MQNSYIFLLLFGAFVACTVAGNDYFWGQIRPDDVLITRDTVSKAFFLGVRVTKKYVFKQKHNLNALTITAVRVVDKKRKNGATATLLSGGPGSKGATIKFESQKSSGIYNIVEVYGR